MSEGRLSVWGLETKPKSESFISNPVQSRHFTGWRGSGAPDRSISVGRPYLVQCSLKNFFFNWQFLFVGIISCETFITFIINLYFYIEYSENWKQYQTITQFIYLTPFLACISSSLFTRKMDYNDSGQTVLFSVFFYLNILPEACLIS